MALKFQVTSCLRLLDTSIERSSVVSVDLRKLDLLNLLNVHKHSFDRVSEMSQNGKVRDLEAGGSHKQVLGQTSEIHENL